MEDKEIFWSRFADDFEQRNTYVIGKQDMDSILNEVSNLSSLGNVLELACGDGVYTNVLAKNADSILATDFSDEMVAVAKKRYSTEDNIKVEKANCFDIHYADDSFDTVFMANLLHVIPNPEKALQESKRVLKENGSLIVLSFTMKEMKLNDRLGMVYRYFKTYGEPPKGGSNLGLEDAKKLIENQGFAIEDAGLYGKKSKAFIVKAAK